MQTAFEGIISQGQLLDTDLAVRMDNAVIQVRIAASQI